MLVEEHSNSPRFNLYNRFAGDVNDLLRVSPNHRQGQVYRYDSDRSHPKPPFTQPAPPDGVPPWAFRQVEQLRHLKRFVLWYIDHRARGKSVATAAVPALKAPVDLLPKRVTVTLDLPAPARLEGVSVVLDPANSMKEVTRVNNRVRL